MRAKVLPVSSQDSNGNPSIVLAKQIINYKNKTSFQHDCAVPSSLPLSDRTSSM